jgi:hypothetical protein
MITRSYDSRLCRTLAAVALAGSHAALTSGAAAVVAADDRIVVGPNTNVLGGPQALSINPFFVRGDVLGKAQNEPSCGIGTRSSQHIICGINDYRMVDVPGVSVTSEVRDAWLGVAQSTDGGDTWESTLHPGFFLDPAPHVLKAENFRAAADPTVRTGPAGLAYYSGIAFSGPDRDEGAVFVSTFIDLNNRETDRMPFKFVRTVLIDRGNRAQFIDKSWMFVEAGAGTCSLQVPLGDGTTVNQTVPASTVHLLYSIFVGNDQNIKTKEMYAKSTDCGATFGKPIKVSESVHVNNGSAIAKPLAAGSTRLYGAWRRFSRPNDSVADAVVAIASNDNGATWTKANVVAEICPFDLNTKKTQFRATAFPSMTADAAGRAYVLWADRGRDPATGACNPYGKARMMMSTSTDGVAWTAPQQVVPSATDEHQIWPTIAFTAGKLVLAWVDFKEDASGVFGQYVDERDVLLNSPPIRHTGDVRMAMANPGASPDFLSEVTKVSRYLNGVGKVNGLPVVGQIQWNAFNKRWAKRGDVPFNGDYIDIGTYSYLPPDPQAGRPDWTPNNGQVPVTPTVLIAWTDNRDMRRPPAPENLDLPDAPPVPYVTPLGLSLPPTSIFDPTQQRPLCTPGFNNYATGTFNQNVYSAHATREFVASSPANNKTLGTIQRAFVVLVRNDSDGLKQFQEAASQPAGGTASFDQFDTTKHSIVVTVPQHSSVARTVFVTPVPGALPPLDPDAVVPVTVTELVGGTPGQTTTIFLNSDKSAPEINGPEINGSEVYTPEINGPEINGQGVLAPEINGPEINGNEVDAGEILSLGIQTPEINGPEINGPEINGPEINGPEINGSALDTGAVTDVVYHVTGKGNTTAQVKAKAFVHGGPPGANYQVIVRRPYPVATVDESCTATTVNVSKVAVSIINSDVSNPEINGSSLDTASFFVAPGETVDFVIRVRTATAPSPAELESLAESAEVAVQQEAVNTADAQQGITEPPVFTSFLSIVDSQLPPGVVGAFYSRQLQASGGKGELTWSVLEGGTGLPPGLTFAAGLISGSPTAAGTSTFTVQVADSATAEVAIKDFALVITPSNTASLAFFTQPSDTGFGQAISPAPSVKAVNSTGAPVAGVPVTIALGDNPTGATLAGALTATTGATGVAVFSPLTVSKAGAGYTLVASAGGYASATSVSFAVGGQPDLVVLALTHSPTAPTTETMATFTAVVKNAGAGPAGPSTLLFKIGGETPGAPGTLFGVPSLAAGETYAVSRQMRLSVAQNYLNTAVADYTGAVAESNEANNTKTDSYSVFPAAPTPMTFVVSNANDAGPGSLRQALMDSNASVGLKDTIVFQIPGPAPHTITPATPLPTITDPVVIDAPPTGDCSVGLAPTVEIDGVSAGPADGLVVKASGTVVRGLSITRFASGILLGTFADGTVVECSYLGLAPDGVTAKGNANGIRISASSNNTIGGTSAALRNVISGNTGFGIDIEAGTSGNSVLGNFIGTSAPGTAAIANAVGVRISGASTVIGGVTTQPGTGAGNVISGNTGDGIHVCGTVLSGAACPIGGPGGSGAVFQGNIIGLDATGLTKVGNGGAGIGTTNGAVQVGGTAAGARNVISGNNAGVALSNSGSTYNTVIQGNYIGTDITGTLDRANGTAVVAGSAPGTLVGGSDPGAGNLISGNGTGISITNISHRALLAGGGPCPEPDAPCYSTVVQGNWIGLNAAGTGALANGKGIAIASITAGSDAGQLVGGLSAAARNVISGNQKAGVSIAGTASIGNAVQGNYIGTNVAGDAAVGNGAEGVLVLASTGNLIGGAGSGTGNVISGNTADGIHLENVNGSLTTIQGNRIGTNAAGTSALPNGVHGLTAISSSSLQIGGTTASERNLISGNGASACPGCGVGVMLVGTNGSFVQGNFIGSDATGTLDLGNQRDGVSSGGSSNTIGGTAAGAGNLIVGNGGGGVVLVQASQNLVQGNLIGTNSAGALLGNGEGVVVFGGTNNTIGGTAAGARNVISGNRGAINPKTSHGVRFSSGGSGNAVLGNLIGLHPNGVDPLGNDGAGIQFNAASGNTVGGTAEGARNIVSANTANGIEIFNASNTAVIGNYIGTDEGGALDRGNGGAGVSIAFASGNKVSGTSDGTAGNLIAFNGKAGLLVASGTGNEARFNSIHSNALLGIDLGAAGVTANDAGDGDTGGNDLQNFPVISSATTDGATTTIAGSLNSTPNTTFVIDFYNSPSCDGSGYGEGRSWLGSATQTTGGNGNVSFTSTLAVSVEEGSVVTAVATSPTHDSSEFSACATVTAPPQYWTGFYATSGAGDLFLALGNHYLVAGTAPNVLYSQTSLDSSGGTPPGLYDQLGLLAGPSSQRKDFWEILSNTTGQAVQVSEVTVYGTVNSASTAVFAPVIAGRVVSIPDRDILVPDRDPAHVLASASVPQTSGSMGPITITFATAVTVPAHGQVAFGFIVPLTASVDATLLGTDTLPNGLSNPP